MAKWQPNFGLKRNHFERETKNIDDENIYISETCKFIYKITCLKNNKSYIGRTSQPDLRISSHYSLLKCGKHKIENLQNDFDEFGEDAFSFEIIGEDNFGLNIERKMQEILKTYDPKYGYNYKDQNWLSHWRKNEKH